MNFYKRFMGDFQRKTGHLSLAEVGAYDRLLDHYYGTEGALPGELQACCRIASAMSKAEKTAVASVLSQFFVRDADGCYRQSRADEEIVQAQAKIKAARANGSRSAGRPPLPKDETERKPAGLAETTQPEPTGKAHQSQKKEKTIPPPPSGGVDGFKRFWEAWPPHIRKVARPQCEALWQKQDLEAKASLIVGHVVAMKASEKWAEDGGKYVPSPLVYLRQFRWEAQTTSAEVKTDWRTSREGINRRAIELGVGAWDQRAFELGQGEHWPAFMARVNAAEAAASAGVAGV